MYRNSLDGLRAICIILTIRNHINGLPQVFIGNFGVDIFFGLSGFLITYLLNLETKKKGQINLRNFYIRRVFRILPLYFLTVFFYFLIIFLINDFEKLKVFKSSFLYLITFNGEYMFSFKSTFGHSWTLGIEEKFYILWPITFFYANKFNTWLYSIIISILLICALLYFCNWDAHVIRGYCGLSFGAILAMTSSNFTRFRLIVHKKTTLVFSLFGIILGYSIILLYQHFIGNILCGLASAFLVANLWWNEKTIVSVLLSNPILVYLGKLTYGIYLIHVLCINIVEALFKRYNTTSPYLLYFTSYLISIICAILINKFIEIPLINFGRKLVKRNKLL